MTGRRTPAGGRRTSADPSAVAALDGAAPRVFWLDDPDRPDPLAPLTGTTRVDLAVVGGGYTGLWAALRAVEREPGTTVAVLEAGRCGFEASGRNGGFCSASLTHGFPNGLDRWPDEVAELERLGAANLAGILATVEEHGIDCRPEATGELSVATAPHEVDDLRAAWETGRQHGIEQVWLDRDQVRARVDSPTYLAGLHDPHGTVLVEPARLAWGLRRACLAAGVTIHEGSAVRDLSAGRDGVVLRTTSGSVTASRVALATNAFPPLLRRLRLMTVPVYDHVLVTEPLSREQKAAIGWEGREGLADTANQFHYYRLTRDDRILWGGYDAVYHYGSRIDPALEQSPTHELLAAQFFETFPQLAGLRFSHRWGGVIDTCTRFAPFFGVAARGRVAYALGYTGLGVGASRFGADVMLDLLAGEETERTTLEMVRTRPLPFPPEPARSVGINLTRWSLDRADRHGGRRNLWLRGLDRAGLGFDS
jgi:glycine/D-amino acid oxidase-like deaminating enzyme